VTMGEPRQFRLPDVGEGLTEATILRWHVRPGDPVTVNQTIVEIETAKAVVELPCPFAGTVSELLVPEDATVAVGVPIITVSVSVPGPEPEQRVPVLVGSGGKPGATTRRRRRNGAEPALAPPPSGPMATPPVRRLARDLGIELAAVAGTGPQGSITRDDVHRAADAVAGRVAAPVTGSVAAPVADGRVTDGRLADGRLADGRVADGREERVPVRGVRKHTAAAMVRSAFTAPHVTAWLQADVTAAAELTDRLRGLAEFQTATVSPLLLVARALILAVKRHPLVNAAWDETNQEIVVKRYVNLGIAAATARGLIVPNVKDADAMSLPELARALTELTTAARTGATTPADLAHGTITISNVGVFGVDAGTPILPPGEAAILMLGQIRDMPWVHDGEIAVRRVATLALSFDHRIVDGDLGAAVLRDVAAMLADPARMLAWS